MGLPARFGLYVLFCLILVAVDTRYATLQGVHDGLNAVLFPTRRALAMPWDWLRQAGGFFVTHGDLKSENARLQREHELLLLGSQNQRSLEAENAHLRSLLALDLQPNVTGLAAEIVQASPDPFNRKVIINRGTVAGLEPGRPVVDGTGLVGQVTRVFPYSAEVSLLTDREQGAPAMNLRNGLRLIVSGTGADNLLEIRFLDMHADVKVGDLLYTSGIDGIYPEGIPVARVVATEPPRHTPFAKALCRPMGGVGRFRHVLVLHLETPSLQASVPEGKKRP